MTLFAPNENTAELGMTEAPPSTSSTQNMKIDLRDFLKGCRTPERYEQEPPGWGKIAAMPGYYHNMDITNTYSRIGMRLIHYDNGRLSFLQDHLDKFDRKGNGNLKGLTKRQTRLPGEPDVMEEYDIIIEEARKQWTQLADNTRRYKEMSELHPVSRDHHTDYVAHIIDGGMLDVDAMGWLGSPAELASVSEPSPRIVERLLHSRVGRFLAEKMLSTPVFNSGVRLIPMELLRALKVAATTLFTLTLLVPVGLLFLCPLTKAESFGVVVAFTFLFSLVVNLHQETDMHKAMLAACALSAVLITVMVQLVSLAPV